MLNGGNEQKSQSSLKDLYEWGRNRALVKLIILFLNRVYVEVESY